MAHPLQKFQGNEKRRKVENCSRLKTKEIGQVYSVGDSRPDSKMHICFSFVLHISGIHTYLYR